MRERADSNLYTGDETMTTTTGTPRIVGQYDNSSATCCCKCRKQLLNPGYSKQSVMCCGQSQPWYKYDYRLVAIIQTNGRWRLWMLAQDDSTPDREFPYNRGHGYATPNGAARAWKRLHADD